MTSTLVGARAEAGRVGPVGTPGTGRLEVLRRPAPVAGDVDLTQVRSAFDVLATTPQARLLVGRCRPTAAFSRRDLLLPGAAEAQRLASAAGFTPAVRHVGGHLAAYDEGSLVLHLWASHDEPARDLQLRFRVLSEAVRDALVLLGVADVRIGAVPGEYCDGEWSVNAGGRAKLAGTGQRVSRHGWMWSAVLTVDRPDALRDVLVAGYRELGLTMDPASIGAVREHLADPATGTAHVAEVVTAHLARAVEEHGLLRPRA